MRRLVVLSLCLAMTFAPMGFAEQAVDPQVKMWNAWVDAHIANNDFSGIVRISRKGRVIYEKTAGFASRAFDVPIRKDTRFPVASVTKTFTAAGIAILERDEKLKIGDGIDEHLPALAGHGIEVQHLLLHQSGLANPPYDEVAARAVTPEELIALIAAEPLQFEPGKGNRYSNAGYIALARLVETVADKPFHEFLRARIFAPLGMKDSGTLRSGVIVPRLAEGYVPGPGAGYLRRAPSDPSSLFGSGNIYSTAADLDTWLTAIDRNALFEIGKQFYPFGWGKRSWFDKSVLVQSGIISGYSSIILTVPEEELHIVVLMNTESPFTADEGKTLLGIAEGVAPAPPPRRGPVATVASSVLEKYAGLYHWGDEKVPMHISLDGDYLTLRWADSSAGVALTPLSATEFLDRSSSGRIRFDADGLVWIQGGEETAAPRAKQ